MLIALPAVFLIVSGLMWGAAITSGSSAPADRQVADQGGTPSAQTAVLEDRTAPSPALSKGAR